MGVLQRIWILGTAVLALGCGGGGGGTPDASGADPGPRDGGPDGIGGLCQRDLDCAGLAAPTCQKAVCEHATGTCVLIPDPSLEGAACTPSDNRCAIGDGQCREGSCVPALEKNCDDHDPCTEDSCNRATGDCDHAPLDQTPCDDGDACTSGDQCQAGTCTAGTRVCQCTKDDECPVPENPCLGRYVCNTDQKTCEVMPGTAVTCEAPANPCLESYCDPANGQCATRNREDGSDCDDDDACTLDDACLQGTCGGRTRDCDDHNDCTQDLCDPTTGQCSPQNLSDTPCDDGDLCTTGERCVQGVCGLGTLIFGCCIDDIDCEDAFACSQKACVNHQCVLTPLECSPPGDDCRPAACRGAGQCDSIPLVRRQRLLDLPFVSAFPPAGVRLEPLEGWDLTPEGILRLAGNPAGRIHLPPFRTGTGLNYLAVHRQGTGGRLMPFVQGNLSVWDYHDDSLAMLPLGAGAQDVVLEVPPEVRISRIQALHFPRQSCQPTPSLIVNTEVEDFGMVDNGQGQLVAGYLFQAESRYRFAIQSFDDEGQSLGPFIQVSEEYPTVHPRFRVQGEWVGDRFVLLYGAVEVEGQIRIRQVEYWNGQILSTGFLSDRADGQYQPALARGPGDRFVCYTSSTIDGSGTGIACREGTGPWFPMNLQTFGDQFDPDVTRFADGRPLVVWADHEGAIRGRVHAPDGPGEFLVQPPVLGGATYARPRVATSGTSAMVVFEGTNVPGEDGIGVFGRAIVDGLVEPAMIVFQQNLIGDQRSPEVAPVADGYLVTFANEGASELWVMRLTTRGAVIGTQLVQSSFWAVSPSHLLPIDPFVFRIGFRDGQDKVRMDIVSGICKEGWYANGQICIGPGYR